MGAQAVKSNGNSAVVIGAKECVVKLFVPLEKHLAEKILGAVSWDRYRKLHTELLETCKIDNDPSYFDIWLRNPKILSLVALVKHASEQKQEFLSEKAALEKKFESLVDHDEKIATKTRIDGLGVFLKALDNGGVQAAVAEIERMRQEFNLPPKKFFVHPLDESVLGSLPDNISPHILERLQLQITESAIQESNSAVVPAKSSVEYTTAQGSSQESAFEAFVNSQHGIFGAGLPIGVKGIEVKFKTTLKTLANLFIEHKGALNSTIIKSAFPPSHVIHKGDTTSISFGSDEMVVIDLSNSKSPVIVLVGSVQEIGKKYSRDPTFGSAYVARSPKQNEIFKSLYSSFYDEKGNPRSNGEKK